MGRLLQRVAEDKLRRALIKMPKAAIMPQSAPPLGPSGRWKYAPMAKPMTADATKPKTRMILSLLFAVF
jgi:hypothetical protein